MILFFEAGFVFFVKNVERILVFFGKILKLSFKLYANLLKARSCELELLSERIFFLKAKNP